MYNHFLKYLNVDITLYPRKLDNLCEVVGVTVDRFYLPDPYPRLLRTNVYHASRVYQTSGVREFPYFMRINLTKEAIYVENLQRILRILKNDLSNNNLIFKILHVTILIKNFH